MGQKINLELKVRKQNLGHTNMDEKHIQNLQKFSSLSVTNFVDWDVFRQIGVGKGWAGEEASRDSKKPLRLVDSKIGVLKKEAQALE